MKLIYSAEALDDLTRLREYIAERNPDAANSIATELLARIDILCRFPEMGRHVLAAPQPDSVRDMVFGNHVVRYLPRGDTLIVLRIWHHLERRS